MAGKKATGKSVQPKKKSTASKTAVSRKKTTTLKKSGGQMKAASGITIRDEVIWPSEAGTTPPPWSTPG